MIRTINGKGESDGKAPGEHEPSSYVGPVWETEAVFLRQVCKAQQQIVDRAAEDYGSHTWIRGQYTMEFATPEGKVYRAIVVSPTKSPPDVEVSHSQEEES